MIMATRTCDGYAHDRFGHNFDLLIDDVHNQLRLILLCKDFGSEREVTRCGKHVSPLGFVSWC